MEFYTYIWRDAGGVPFYVGKGKGRRAYELYNRSHDFKEIHSQGGCSVEILDYFIHESQAHAHEVELIAAHGRRDQGGLLINKTDGGEGIVGAVRSVETRAKIAESKRGKKHSPATLAKLSEAHRGILHTLSTRTKISEAHRGKLKSPETRAKMSEAASNISDWHRAKLSAANRMAPPRADNSSGFKGVSFYKRTGKWRAGIAVKGRIRTIGYFLTPEDAAKAYDEAAINDWGAGNCYLNFEIAECLG